MKLVEQYNKIIFHQRSLFSKLSCDVWKPNFKIYNFFFVCIMINTVVYYIVNAYSIVIFSDDLLKLAFCLVTYGIGIQLGDKIRVYVINGDTIKKIDQMLINFHHENEQLDIQIQQKVAKQLKLCYYIVIFLKYFYFIGGAIFVSLSILVAIASKEKLLLFGFVLPGIDYKKSPGYELNWAFQLFQTYCVLLGANVTDGIYATFLLNGRLQLNVLIALLKNLNTFINNNGDKLEQERLFNDIIKKHVEHTRYMRLLENNFSNHFFVLISTGFFQLLITAFVLAITTWYSGYLMLLQAESQIFIICFLGTKFSLKCDEFEREVYNIDWYSMEIKQQKKLLLVLQMAQKPIMPTYGGLAVFGMHTFLEVNKSIYSSLMVFLSYT